LIILFPNISQECLSNKLANHAGVKISRTQNSVSLPKPDARFLVQSLNSQVAVFGDFSVSSLYPANYVPRVLTNGIKFSHVSTLIKPQV
jgi:hypothetical protein